MTVLERARYRIKIVPKTSPDADGEWREVEAELLPGARWIDLAVALGDHVPNTHFLCSIETAKPAKS
ncbi:MAG: hypothetical protein ACXWLZ_00060 [Rhizomicrobium sp.]